MSNDFAELCETIADAKAVSDGTAVELRCKPIASIDSGFFIMGEDGSSDTLKVYFTVVFSEPVTDLDDADDVEITGDAGGTKTIAITQTDSEGKEYNVAVSGMTDGTVIASIPCGKALGQSGVWNYESTSTDNSVLFDDVPPDAPTNAFLDLIVRSTGRIHTKWTTSPSSDVTAVALSAISAWSTRSAIPWLSQIITPLRRIGMKKLSVFSICMALMFAIAAPVLSADYRTHLFGWVSIDYGGMGIAISNQNLALCETASANDTRSFLWQKDAGIAYITDPGTFRYGYGLNNLGYVAGSGRYDTAAVRHPDGYMEILPMPPEAAYPFATAMRINDAGQVVGVVGADAVFWGTDRATTIIGDNVLRFAGINASAQTAWTDQSGRSYLWSQSGGSVDLAPVAGQTRSTVFGINDSGLVVGESGNRAVLWRTPGNPMQLPLLPGTTTARARGINPSEQIVGEANFHAVLWDADGSIVDLSQYIGGYNSVATGINDNGWIVGTVYAPGGDLFAAVWEPVPEPSSFLVLGSGILASAGVIRKRR